MSLIGERARALRDSVAERTVVAVGKIRQLAAALTDTRSRRA